MRGLHSDSPMELTREAAYKIYLYPDPQQEYILSKMIESRHQMATLCGYKSYAERLVL